MAFRRFKAEHRHAVDGRDIVFPRGWAGEVSDEVATAADTAGATHIPDAPADDVAGVDSAAAADTAGAKKAKA